MQRIPLKLSLPLGFSLLFASSAFVTRAPQLPDGFVLHELRGGVRYIEGNRGGNIGVSVGEDGLLVIDDHLRNLGDQVEAALAAISDADVRFVLNTHFHADHSGNNARIAKGAPIVAHSNVRSRLRAEGRDAAGLPVVTYDTGLKLFVNGDEVELVHFPNGHTDGDSVVFFKEANVVHMGDLMFSGRFPYIDVNSGGSAAGYCAALRAVLERVDDETLIIPGHGPLSRKADLAALLAMLEDCLERVREALAAGKQVDDMKREGLIGDYGDDWRWGFIDEDRFLEILASSEQGR